MKNRKEYTTGAKTAISSLALMLTLSVGAVFPGLGAEGGGAVTPPPELPSVEEEIPEADEGDGIRPLSDLDEPVTLD